MSKRDEFIGKPYSERTFKQVKEESYRREVPQSDIFIRFENLDVFFTNMNVQIGGYREMKEEVLPKFEYSEKGVIPAINRLRQFPNSEMKSRLLRKLRSADLPWPGFIRAIKTKNLRREILGLTEEEAENARKIYTDSEKQYSEEINFVYQTKRVGRQFAHGRIIKPGKFRLGEPYLMVANGIIPAEDIFDEEIFEKECITSSDRIMLAKATNPATGEYLVSLPLIKEKWGYLSSRKNAFEKILEDVSEIPREFDPNPLQERIDDMEYEINELNSVIKERETA